MSTQLNKVIEKLQPGHRKLVLETLEEASIHITSRVLNNNLLKNGTLTLEESNFINKLVREVIYESAEDFLPQEEDFSGISPSPLEEPEDKVLTDDNGNKFIYRALNGELEPATADSLAHIEALGTSSDSPYSDETLPEIPSIPTPVYSPYEINENTIASNLLTF